MTWRTYCAFTGGLSAHCARTHNSPENTPIFQGFLSNCDGTARGNIDRDVLKNVRFQQPSPAIYVRRRCDLRCPISTFLKLLCLSAGDGGRRFQA